MAPGPEFFAVHEESPWCMHDDAFLRGPSLSSSSSPRGEEKETLSDFGRRRRFFPPCFHGQTQKKVGERSKELLLEDLLSWDNCLLTLAMSAISLSISFSPHKLTNDARCFFQGGFIFLMWCSSASRWWFLVDGWMSHHRRRPQLASNQPLGEKKTRHH